MPRRQEGFTLIELLVVILIIAILAAIAIPVFLRQREKGYEAQMRSALKNAATATESFAVANAGSYGGLNAAPQLANRLKQQGFTIPTWASTFTIEATGTTYCILAFHDQLPDSSEWQTATYDNMLGEPQITDTCP